METETILIILGAILIAIGIIGGNLEWKELRIPKIHIVARALGFFTGLALIVVGPNIKTIGAFSQPSNEKVIVEDATRLTELQHKIKAAQQTIKTQERQLTKLQRQQQQTQKARQVEEQKLATLLKQQENAQKSLTAQMEQLSQPQKNFVAHKQQLALLKQQQKETQQAIINQKQRLSYLHEKIDAAQKMLAAKTQQLAELQVQPPAIETPNSEKMNVSDNFNPALRQFETMPEYETRMNQALQQRQAGVAHLKNYNMENEKFLVSLDWQAAWVNNFLSIPFPKYAYIKIAPIDAKAIFQSGTEKPLFLTVKIVKDSLKGDGTLAWRGKVWPITILRYFDNGNGTVTDTRTGLILLKNVNCFHFQNWKTAMQSSAKLAHGECDLNDGSKAGDWHLPTKKESLAMVDKRDGESDLYYIHMFSFHSKSTYFWSSTAASLNSAWRVSLFPNGVSMGKKSDKNRVWPIRGGQ